MNGPCTTCGKYGCAGHESPLFAKLVAEAGGDPEKLKPARAVVRSPEFTRIAALPRREWESRNQDHVEAFFMQHLRAPGGTQRLRPVQIATLWEMHDRKGAFISARTGAGKTLVSLLGFIVLNSVKPLLIVPAALKEKTLRDMQRYRKDWLVPPYIRILSYELIGRPQSAAILEDYQPDVVIMDECFVGATMITTDVGDVTIRDIVENGVGTYALSSSPAVDSPPTWQRIVRRLRIDRRHPLVRVVHERGEFTCTAEHKIYVNGRAIEARHLVVSDPLRVVQRAAGPAQESFLRSFVLGEMANEASPALARSESGSSHQAVEDFDWKAATMALRADEAEQSVEAAGGGREDQSSPDGRRWLHVPVEGRERKTDGAATDSSGSDRVSDGVRRVTGRGEGFGVVRVGAEELQSGSGLSGAQDRHRGGRQLASNEEVAVSGSAQDRYLDLSRVVRVEVLERGGSDRSAGSASQDSVVYDLEIEGTHTYFADGVLVSNCHRAKSNQAACTKRLKDYFEGHPDTKIVAMSGTIAKRSIKDYAHIADWCLREKSPVPREFKTLMEWSSALDDEKSFITEEGERTYDDQNQSLEPGVLLELCNAQELAEPDRLRGVRKAYRRRLTDTPGVIATQEAALGTSLQINPLIVKDAAITAAAGQMRQTWERPDGVEFMDSLEMFRHLRTLACGFYHRWNPPPSAEWRDARREWASIVREILRTNRRGLHSEVPVREAVAAGLYGQDELDALNRWIEIAPTYDPEKNKEAVWISAGALDAAAAWAKTNPGLIWVSYPEFGNALSQRTGMPFYWNKGLDAKGRFIEDHPKKTPMIASIHANSAGLNLQYGWSKMLYTTFPTTGLAAEQSLSRVHREGQLEDEVVADVCAAIPESLSDFDQACADARRATDMEGQEQRLCYADITIPPPHERGGLWQQ